MVQVGPADEDPRRSPPRRAQGLVEYGLIIALVAVIAIAGLVLFGFGFVGDQVGTLDALLVVAVLLVPSALLVPAARKPEPQPARPR